MKTLSDLDPQLRDLPLALEPGGVARLFEARWPGPLASSGPVTVRSCKLRDVKYHPLTRCTATYELVVSQGENAWQTVGIVEISANGVAHRLFTDDPRLPWLAAANDSEGMRERFAGLPGIPPIESAAVTPVRYKPGLRCAFRYDLHVPSGRQVFFGKLFAEGDQRLARTIGALHEASLHAPAMPRVLALAGYWPDIHLLVQPAVAGGTELNDVAYDATLDAAEREAWVRAAGGCLVALHACHAVEGPGRTMRDDLGELSEYVPLIAQANPELAWPFEDASRRIAAIARDLDEAPPVASHGAFRTDQVMIDEAGRLVMIDLDSFCRANPARDVGNFLAYLDWKEIRRPDQAAFIERARRTFLEGYLAEDRKFGAVGDSTEGRPYNEAWLAVYRAASLLKIAGRRYRSLSVKEWPLTPRLVEKANQLLTSAKRG